MAINDKIRDETLQYDVSREAARISLLSSGKIDKYEYLTVEEMLPPDQSRIIRKVSLLISFRKSFRKRKKYNWTPRRKSNKSNQTALETTS